MKRRVLVFPCGSEIGLEIHRALCHSTHFELVGASSVDDHGRFVYENYLENLPFHDTASFIPAIQAIIKNFRIDAIYPTMDAVAETFQNHADLLGIPVIGSSPETTRVCASKNLTYDILDGLVPTPRRYARLQEVAHYPIFIKPDRGYGSRHTLKAPDADSARAHLASHPEKTMLLLEYLPGKEWTVDCFSDKNGKLLFHAARGRNRVSNGISVNTSTCDRFKDVFAQWAAAINARLKPRGAWFFQCRLDTDEQPKLLEVAARFAGSSALQRASGVNLPLLSLFDAFDVPVSISQNHYDVELDRALSNRFMLKLNYKQVYVDLDDCLIVNGRINTQLITFLYKAINDGCALTLLTRHAGNLTDTLEKFRVKHLFDEVVHITDGTPKSAFIRQTETGAIFIDDSFKERQDVSAKIGIPVFSPDMLEALL